MKWVKASVPASVAALLVACAASGTSPSDNSDVPPSVFDAGAPDVPPGTFDAPPLCSGKHVCSPTAFNEIVDCSGATVATCSLDQGCKDGRCVSACEAVGTTETTIGCEFYTHIPDTEQADGFLIPVTSYDGACFALFVVNTWSTDLTINVELGGKPIPNTSSFTDFTRIVKGTGSATKYVPLDATGKVHPGDVAVVFLASGDPASVPSNFISGMLACPNGVTPAIVEAITELPASSNTTNSNMQFAPEWEHGTHIRKSFHVTTSAPAAVYDVYPFGAGSSPDELPGSSLLLPVASWKKNYITVDPAETFFNGSGADAWISMIASKPNTHITIVPPVDIPSFGNVKGARRGVPFTYTLQAGEVLEVAQGPEFAGAPIVSDQPIGVFGGHECLVLPSPANQGLAYGSGCDAAHAQIPPIANWGTRYVAAPMLRSASDAMQMRFIGAVDGTTLTYAPSAPPGAPTTLANGQVADVLFSKAFVVKSQDALHPFYAATIMTNCEVSGTTGSSCGDPEFVNAVPPEEFMTKYTLFAEPSYPNATLSIVEEKGTSGYDDVTVDCLDGNHVVAATWWTEIPSAGFRYANLPLRQNGMPVGTCDAGVHAVESRSRFGLTVWGVGDHTSYAYVPAMGTKALSTVVVPAGPK